MVTVKVQAGDAKLKLTPQEARKLYEELKQLFEAKSVILTGGGPLSAAVTVGSTDPYKQSHHIYHSTE